jgi:hypothetical protein
VILGLVVRDVHHAVAFVVVFSNAIAGIWALTAHYRETARGRPLWWFIIGAQSLVYVQAGLGVGIQQSEDLEPPDFHYLYGFTMIIVIAMLYGYRQQMEQQKHLLYAGGSLFLMGLGIRSMLLG